MFVIRLANGEEVQASDGDELEINQETGVLTVSRVDGFEEITTHYSPSAWLTVTHRKRGAGVRPSLILRWHGDHANPHSQCTANSQRIHANRSLPGPTSTAVTMGFAVPNHYGRLGAHLDFSRPARVAV